jgi:hypothetical protein
VGGRNERNWFIGERFICERFGRKAEGGLDPGMAGTPRAGTARAKGRTPSAKGRNAEGARPRAEGRTPSGGDGKTARPRAPRKDAECRTPRA